MYISFWPDNDHNPRNNPDKGKPSKLYKEELTKVLDWCKKYSFYNDKQKDKASIFPFISNYFETSEEIEENSTHSEGIFVDIDVNHGDKDKSVSDIIYDSFEQLCNRIPNLYAIWFSTSHNIHLAFWTENLNKTEYKKQALLAMTYTAIAIRKCTEITLSDNEESKQLDTHQTSISQRFRLNHIDEYKVNENVMIGNFPELDDVLSTHLDEMSEIWPVLFNEIKKLNTNTRIVYKPKTINKFATINTTNVLPHNYIAHKTRWKLFDTIFYISNGDNALFEQLWCKCCKLIPEVNGHNYEFYKNEPFKNKWDKKYTGEYVDLDLAEEFGIQVTSKQKLHLDKGEYISKYKNDIIDAIEKYERVCVKANTGVGKTVLINGNKNDIGKSIAEIYNAIIIVPYNTTNNLYCNSIEIGTQSGNFKIDDNKSCVMVWDQAVMHWEEIKDRNFIIDECHRLFLDTDWRDVSISLLNKLKSKTKGKIIMFSATPAGEVDLIGAKMIEISNSRNKINLRFIETKHIDTHQLNYIKKVYNGSYYDRIVVFDDLTVKKIKENLIVDASEDYDILDARSDTRYETDVKKLIENEQLTHKITLCTRAFYEGLNFVNENERILVISSFRSGYTTSHNLIQQIGRIRNSEVTALVFFDNKDYSKTIEDDDINNAIIQSEYEKQGIKKEHLSYDIRLIDKEWLETNKKMYEWTVKHSNLDNVIAEMNNYGYFNINVAYNDNNTEESKNGDRLTLKLKKKYSDEFKNDIIEDEWDMTNYFEHYKQLWQGILRKILSNKKIKGLTLDHIKKMITDGKDVIIETIFDKLIETIHIVIEEDSYWEEYNIKMKKLLNELDEVHKKKLISKMKHIEKVKEEVKGIITINNIEDKVEEGFVGDLFDFLVLEEANKQKERCDKNVKNGKIGGKIGKQCIITDKFKHPEKYGLNIGDIFDSQIDLSDKTNKSIQTISKWRVKGWITSKNLS